MAALKALQSALASQLPPNVTLAVNWRALLFTAAIAGVTALLTGIWPAIQSSRNDMVEHLKDGARGSSRAHGHRSRQALVVAEVALSVALLIGAALLLSSFLRLQRTDGGFVIRGRSRELRLSSTNPLFNAGPAGAILRRGRRGARSGTWRDRRRRGAVPAARRQRPRSVLRSGRPADPARAASSPPLVFMNIVSHTYFDLPGDSGGARTRVR